ncbi:MAG: 1-acyl-sn-glycerol-3-phosphate acyltransferase [Candidatus Obscuribacterales bacterium]|nr:1-acyl-sn-glycerol-3-phosphate acyltransferase [Candidatus Obscuribacterales bacterium]
MEWALYGAVIALACYLVWRVAYWVRQGRKMRQSGFLPPEPTRCARLTLGFASRLLLFLGVGPVKVIGAENARRHRGRLLITPNHTFELDFAMVRRALGFGFRFMTHTHQLRGFQGILGAWTGAIPVEPEKKGGGDAAVDAAVNMFKSSPVAKMLMFPQGKLVRDNVIRPEDFRWGFAKISHRTAAETDADDMAVLPMALLYLRDVRDRHWTHFLLAPLRRWWGVTNYGGIVVIGEPILVKDLPEDPSEATALVRQRIERMLAYARGEDGALVVK